MGAIIAPPSVKACIPCNGSNGILNVVVRRVLRCIARHGVGRDDDDGGDALDQLAAESLQPGVPGVQRPQGRFAAFQDGFSLHCGVGLHENDPAGAAPLAGTRAPVRPVAPPACVTRTVGLSATQRPAASSSVSIAAPRLAGLLARAPATSWTTLSRSSTGGRTSPRICSGRRRTRRRQRTRSSRQAISQPSRRGCGR